MIELSKSDKKAARILIDTGLDREYAHGLRKAARILEDWLKGDLDNRDAYMKLYKQVSGYDRHIAERYNDLTGSRYLITVIGLLFDEVISEDELHGFSDNTREFIVEAAKKFKD